MAFMDVVAHQPLKALSTSLFSLISTFSWKAAGGSGDLRKTTKAMYFAMFSGSEVQKTLHCLIQKQGGHRLRVPYIHV